MSLMYMAMYMPPPPSFSSLHVYGQSSQYRSLLVEPGTTQGKVAELRLELNSSGGKKDKAFSTKRIALKKIVANMTMSNNDMVALFPDIVGVMGLPSLEIKKM